MNIQEMRDLVAQITYKPGWQVLFELDKLGGNRPYIQISAATPDSTNPAKVVPWRSAKHYLSSFMCRQEVIGTVYHAIERAELHEMNEFFRYKGASIYNPHLDPDVLVDVAKRRSSFNTRDDAMAMKEAE